MSPWPVLAFLVWTYAAEVRLETQNGLVLVTKDSALKQVGDKAFITNNAPNENEAVELETEYLCKEATRTIVHWRSKNFPIFGIDKYNRYALNVYNMKDGSMNNLTKFAEYFSDPGVPYVKVLDMKPDSTYTFGILVRTNASQEPIEIFTNHTFQTLAEDYTNISTVSNSNISVPASYGGHEVKINFTWTPVPENVCSYELLILNKNASIGDRIQHLFSRAQDLYTMEISKLTYGGLISIAVYAANLNHEGNKFWMSFRIPHCVEFYNWDYHICKPFPPENVTVSVKDCVLDLKWGRPKHPPPSYHLLVIPNNPKRPNVINETIPGEYPEFRASTRNMGEYMTVILTAHSHAGSSSVYRKGLENECTPEEAAEPYGPGYPIHHHSVIHPTEAAPQLTSGVSIYLVLIIVCLVIIAVLLAVLAGYKIYKARKAVTPEVLQEYELREPLANDKTSENDDGSVGNTSTVEDEGELEVRRQALHLKEVIGEGEFGVVRRAYLVRGNDKREVAVKMLRDDASGEDKKQLKSELEVMKSVGTHNNIVCLVGFCSSIHMLVVEYCSVGDLQNYLRDIWRSKNWAKAVYKQNNPDVPWNNFDYLPILVRSSGGENVVNNLLYNKTEVEKKQLNVTIFDLISLARQVALGMEHLSNNKVVHRDLAARNILLDSAFTAKISDFGLSRDVYEENMYRHKGVRRLPVKWMALECLAHQMFTSQSDVWSFGILLWEIMTLGGCPYPSLQSAQVYKSLQKGERLERPRLCPRNLYDVMYECWNAIPHQRPTFSQLVKRLEVMMQSDAQHKYLELDEVMVSYSHLYEVSEEQDVTIKPQRTGKLY